MRKHRCAKLQRQPPNMMRLQPTPRRRLRKNAHFYFVPTVGDGSPTARFTPVGNAEAGNAEVQLLRYGSLTLQLTSLPVFGRYQCG